MRQRYLLQRLPYVIPHRLSGQHLQGLEDELIISRPVLGEHLFESGVSGNKNGSNIQFPQIFFPAEVEKEGCLPTVDNDLTLPLGDGPVRDGQKEQWNQVFKKFHFFLPD